MELTPSQTIGPFFRVCWGEDSACLADSGIAGERIQLRCRVLDGEGTSVSDAMIEIWQADSTGAYNRPGFRGFGRACTNEDGACMFETIKPGRVADKGDVLQAPHVNVNLFARGLLKQLVTRIYFAGEPANQEDAVLALVPEGRRDTLLARSGDPGVWDFEIRLASECETVFFDA
jgi:protocatechuate 3,4-dioxygenase alpha subunit